MQQQIEATQKELETLLDTRSRTATPPAAGKKVALCGPWNVPA
ncbi:MAG: hypothetical protein WDN28_33640 [Chthoniobacter sp.]